MKKQQVDCDSAKRTRQDTVRSMDSEADVKSSTKGSNMSLNKKPTEKEMDGAAKGDREKEGELIQAEHSETGRVGMP